MHLDTNLARTTADLLAHAYTRVCDLNSVGEDASMIELDAFTEALVTASESTEVDQSTVLDICENLYENGVLTGAGILGALAYCR